MTQEELVHLGIRIPTPLMKRILLIQSIHEESTGFKLSQTAIIINLLNEALNNRESKASLASRK